MRHYDETLQAMRLPHKGEFVQTSFGLTHVVVCSGAGGKPVILWNGQNAYAYCRS